MTIKLDNTISFRIPISVTGPGNYYYSMDACGAGGGVGNNNGFTIINFAIDTGFGSGSANNDYLFSYGGGTGSGFENV